MKELEIVCQGYPHCAKWDKTKRCKDCPFGREEKTIPKKKNDNSI
jgi:hypothetical protein